MSSESSHPSRETLAAFLWGHLSADALAGVASHVEECDTCCQALREIPDDPLAEGLRGVHPRSGSANSPARAARVKDTEIPPELQDHPRYQVGQCLGSGGMGVVFQAEHRMMNRLVALKVIHRDLIRRPRVLERFRQEVKAAGRLSHPNIVTAYDADQAGDLHFLVMEHVDGISIDRFVRRQGALEPGLACHLIMQAARGLQHAFEMGMVHRDIKPQNLMLTRKGQIKILDFGLARVAAESPMDFDNDASLDNPELTLLGAIVGTPDFMAPEQANDPSNTDIRADIYSLGCTFYYLLTADVPFPYGSARAKIFAHRYRQPCRITEVRADLPTGLVEILDRLIAKDPARRFQTPADVVKALMPFTKGTPSSASPPASTPSTVSKRQDRTEKAGATTPSPVSPVPGQEFIASCPFCNNSLRVPLKKQGSCLQCQKCGSFFTAVSEDEAF